MNIAESLTIDDYIVEIHYDDDASNPLKEDDGAPTLVLHRKAEGHFGWTNDEAWGIRINNALERLAESTFTKDLYGERGALATIARWLRVFYGVRAVLPVSAMEHSGTTVYLGQGAHWNDPGGWDSGWIGWLFWSGEQIAEGWPSGISDERLAHYLAGSFEQFTAYVSQDVYGYVITAPDGDEVGSCWGFYGPDCNDEAVDQETVAGHLLPGDKVRCPDGSVDTIVAITDDLGTMTEPTWVGRSPTFHQGAMIVAWADRSSSSFSPEDEVIKVAAGYMREEILDSINRHRTRAAEEQAKIDAELASDEAEVIELRLAEIGA